VAYDTAVGGNPLVSKEASDAAKGRAKERGEGLKKTLSNPGQAVQDWSDRLTADVKSGHPGAAAGHLLFDAFSIAAGGGGGGAAKAGAAGKAAGAAGKAGDVGKVGDAARAGGAADSAGSRLSASVGKDCVSNSFLPGTAVLLADGSQKAIEDVKPGDKVLASDPEKEDTEKGDTEGRPVTRLITGNGTKHLVDVTVDTDGDAGDATGTVTATAGHPFWVDERGEYVDAGRLAPGDTVTTPSGEHLAVVATRAYERVQRVYNLTVDGIHTYYVLAGDAAVLVHNCGTGQAFGTACTCSASQSFSRFGTSWESTGRLGRSAAAAEETGRFGHGVSVTTRAAEGASTATRQQIEDAGFSLKYTPTRNDPMHHTLELPKPVDAAVARTFNELFGRSR
jgi:hypothetical protein